MASDRPGDSIVTVVTCEGNFSDPQFPYKLSSLVKRLKRLLYADDKPFCVTNVEPWNSVRVTFNIPREAAQRLRQLAQAGDRVLRDLGILSVQIEGDQVISLTIAGHFNEPQEIVLQATEDDRPRTSSQVSQSFDLSNDGSRASSSVDANRKTAVQILTQPGSAEAGSLAATASASASSPTSTLSSLSASSSSASSNTQESLFNSGQMVAQTDFKSPNVVAPKNEPIPFPPKITTSSSRSQTPFGPFPFASMTHAMNTMHGIQMHGSQINTVTQTPYTKFSFSPSSPFPPHSPSSASSSSSSPAVAAAASGSGGAGGNSNSSGNSAFQSVKPPALPSVQSPSTITSTAITSTATVTTTTVSPTTTTAAVVNYLQRAVVDRANAALTSPLLVNLLQSDLSSSGGGSGKQTLPHSLSEVTKRKRKPLKSKEETVTSNSDANSGSMRTSPGCSSRGSLNNSSNSNLECTSTLSLFSQPFHITPLSPLTPPSASPPSLLGQPFVVTAPETIMKTSLSFSRHHNHHHQIPTLPSPPPTAPSSSTSASNNSGQSSLEAEHELSPWPSPSKRTQHLINPFTGQLEPMSSDDDIDDANDDVRNSGNKSLFEGNSAMTSSSMSSSNSSSSLNALSESNSNTVPVDRSFRESECAELKVREVRDSITASSLSEQQRTTNLCLSPTSVSTTATTASGGGSPSEKIKLRLKLDPSCDRQKTESAVTPSLQYKVDVSFVNIPTRRITGTTTTTTASVCDNSVLTSVATTQSAGGCSTSSSSPTGNTSPCASSSEPRVPPLHISLRGRNAAVVTSPRKEEKDWCLRLTSRTDFSTSSTTTLSTPPVLTGTGVTSTAVAVGCDIAASPKAQRSRTSRAGKETQGRRQSVSRGGGHSRRSRVAGQNLASQNNDNLNSQQTSVTNSSSFIASRNSPQSPPSSQTSTVSHTVSSTIESVVSSSVTEVPLSSPLSQQPAAAATREKALLSGGSLLVKPPTHNQVTNSSAAEGVTNVNFPKIDVGVDGEVSVNRCVATQRLSSDNVESSSTINVQLSTDNEHSNSMQSPVHAESSSDSTNTCDNLTNNERVTGEDPALSSSPQSNNVQNSANCDANVVLSVNKTTLSEDTCNATTTTTTVSPPSTSDRITATIDIVTDSDVVPSNNSKELDESVELTTNQSPVANQANPREALATCETPLNPLTAKAEQPTSTSEIVQSAPEESTEVEEKVAEVKGVVIVTPSTSAVTSFDDSLIKTEEENASCSSATSETNVKKLLTNCADERFVEMVKEDLTAGATDASRNDLKDVKIENENASQRSVEESVAAALTTFEHEALILSATTKDVIVPSVQMALSPPLISSRVGVETAASILTSQVKLRVASVALGSSNMSCLVGADDGAMLVERLPSINAEEDAESDVVEFETRTASSHIHQLSRGTTTVLANMTDSPCLASPSGSSPDSLLTTTGGEESSGDQGSVGVSGNSSSGSGAVGEQVTDKPLGEEDKGQHQPICRNNYQGGVSPCEDSGVESMDATTEKSSGGESPCESANEHFISTAEVNHSSNHEKSNQETESEEAKTGDNVKETNSLALCNSTQSGIVENVPSTIMESECSAGKNSESTECAAETSSSPITTTEPEAEDMASLSGIVENVNLSLNEIKSECEESAAKVTETESTQEPEKVEETCKGTEDVPSENHLLEPEAETTKDKVETSDEATVKTEPIEEVKIFNEEKKDEVSVKDVTDDDVSVSHSPQPSTAEEKKSASDDDEEDNLFLEEHSINGQEGLLASVVFGDQVMTVEDELGIGSPSEATTQLLVFTVEDGESIVVTEDSEHHMSLLRLTQADSDDPNSTLHFSALEPAEGSDVGVHITDSQHNTTDINEQSAADMKESDDECEVSAAPVIVSVADENPHDSRTDPEAEINDEVSSNHQAAKKTVGNKDLLDEIPEKSESTRSLSLLPQLNPVLNCGVVSDVEASHSQSGGIATETHRSVALPIKFVALPSILNSHLTKQSSGTSSDAVTMINSVETSASSLKMLINHNSPISDEQNVLVDVSRRLNATSPLTLRQHLMQQQPPPLSPKLKYVNESVIFSPLASTSAMLTPLHSEESQSSPSVNAMVNHASSSDGNNYHHTVQRRLGYAYLDGDESDSSTSSLSNDMTTDYKDEGEGEGFMGITSVTSGDHNYIFRASSMPKRLRGTKLQSPPSGHLSNSNSVDDNAAESNCVPEDANGDLSNEHNDGESLAQLSVEIPNDDANLERRLTRNTKSNSLSSPDKCTSTAQSSPDSIHSNCRTLSANDIEEVEKESEAIDGEIISLSGRLKRKREDSDSDSDRKSSAVLLPLTSAAGINVNTDDRETTTNSGVHHMYNKPVKRKSSANAAELIKACIGVDEAPKKAGNVKQPVVDGSRNAFNRNSKPKEEIANKNKVDQYSTVTTSEGSSDDEVTLSELVTKTRAVKSKQVTTAVDYPAVTPRNVTRNAKQKQSMKAASASSGVLDEELGRISGAGGRGKNGRAIGSSRKESHKETKEGSAASRVGNRGGRAQEKANNKKIKEQNDRSSSPALGASALTAQTSAQNKPSTDEVVGGKRKLRSSGSSGYCNSLPQKRKRFSRDNR